MRAQRFLATALLILGLAGMDSAAAQTQQGFRHDRPFGTLQEQAEIQQRWLQERLEVNVPKVMRDHGVDMWVMPMREYNEDPVFRALVSPTTFAARRRTIYVFFDRGEAEGVERLALGGTSQGGLYEAYRAARATSREGVQAELWGAQQWQLLAQVIEERDPQVIAVNASTEHNFADGLTAAEWEAMSAALGAYSDRVVRNPRLAIDYLALRVPAMTPVYRKMQTYVHQIIATAFSNAVITPGVTTTQDVVWWMRQRVHDLGFGSWFQPSVSIQRQGVSGDEMPGNPVIERGDVLHTDFGIYVMGMATDTQHMGYVLREGELSAPAGLSVALANANRLQDILLEEMEPGRSGNDVLYSTLEKMKAEGLNGTMYTHPIGDHGHGAGPLIGLWDYQEGVPGRGDVPVLANMWFSTELQVTTPVPEWGDQPVRMALEEEAEVAPDGSRHWSLRRQTELHLIH
jgi:hypothetical protein